MRKRRRNKERDPIRDNQPLSYLLQTPPDLHAKAKSAYLKLSGNILFMVKLRLFCF